jgi:hypothetical protein
MHPKRRLLVVAAAILALTALAPAASASSPRSGQLHLTKDCSAYTGLAGDICTITSSSVAAIPVGSTIVYDQAANFATGVLETDVTIHTRPGNRVFGHCTLNLGTGAGVCTLSGGSGRFTWFTGRADVSYLGGPDWAWDGTYSFGPRH